MALSSDFINAVDSHDNIMTRIMLKDSMLVDLTLKQFHFSRKASLTAAACPLA